MADEVLQATLVECGWNVAMAVDRVFEGRYSDPTQHLLDQVCLEREREREREGEKE